MGRVSPFILLEETFSYKRKERVGKQIPSKCIPSGTVEPLKETKDMLEDENDKQVLMIIGRPLENKEILRDKNDKQVHTSMGDPFKNKEMFRDKNVKRVRTYSGVLSTGNLSNKR